MTDISIVEEAILNPSSIECATHPGALKGWRRYRIEYGFECGCPEGVVYLPPDMDPDVLESLIASYIPIEDRIQFYCEDYWFADLHDVASCEACRDLNTPFEE
jgi:hypothetical protein